MELSLTERVRQRRGGALVSDPRRSNDWWPHTPLPLLPPPRTDAKQRIHTRSVPWPLPHPSSLPPCVVCALCCCWQWRWCCSRLGLRPLISRGPVVSTNNERSQRRKQRDDAKQNATGEGRGCKVMCALCSPLCVVLRATVPLCRALLRPVALNGRSPLRYPPLFLH